MSVGPLRARVIQFRLPAGSGRETTGGRRGAVAHRRGTLLELQDADGRSGWGEASPLPGFANETPEHAAAVLLAWIAGSGPGGTIAGAIEARSPPVESALLAASPAARAAVVSSLLDLAGRRDGVPMRELLAGEREIGRNRPSRPDFGPVDESIPLNALIGLDNVESAVLSAAEAAQRGISTIKAKLGPAVSFDADLAALRAIRTAVGPAMAIRLDVNGLWNLSEARPNLDRLAVLEPEYIEEPVAGLDLLELGESAVPLAADESLQDPHVAARLLDADAITVVVLKPSPLGGLDRCMELAARANSHGKRCVVTHSFEGPVGHGAACELALAIGMVDIGGSHDAPMAAGLDRHAALDAWSDVVVPQLRGSCLVAAAVSGHGVDPTPLLERSGANGAI